MLIHTSTHTTIYNGNYYSKTPILFEWSIYAQTLTKVLSIKHHNDRLPRNSFLFPVLNTNRFKPAFFVAAQNIGNNSYGLCLASAVSVPVYVLQAHLLFLFMAMCMSCKRCCCSYLWRCVCLTNPVAVPIYGDVYVLQAPLLFLSMAMCMSCKRRCCSSL